MQETENKEPSLLETLQQETENKAPAANNESFTWSFDEKDVSEATIIEEEQPGKETAKEETKTAAAPGKKEPEPKPSKVSEKVKRGSARTAVGMLDVLQKSIFTPLIGLKYKKKFTEAEINRLDESNIVDANKSDLQDQDLVLRNKWDRVMKKCNKKLDAIPLNETEKQDLEEAFYTYFDIKEKSLPPEWYLGFAIIKSIGDRTIDLMSD